MTAQGLQRDQQKWPSLGAFVDVAIENRLKSLRTATPGFIVSFDKDSQTASVQPAIKMMMGDGTQKDLPLCLDVPVKFPRGGDFVMTFPVKAGDECLLIFADRCIDGWFSGGSTAAPADYRMHDLSDGFALVGFSSTSGKVSGFDTDGVSLRNLDKTTSVKLADDGSVTTKTQSGSYAMTADGAMTIDAPVSFAINSPQIILNGALSQGSGSYGGDCTLKNNLTTEGDIKAGDISLRNHRHGDPHGGKTGGAEA